MFSFVFSGAAGTADRRWRPPLRHSRRHAARPPRARPVPAPCSHLLRARIWRRALAQARLPHPTHPPPTQIQIWHCTLCGHPINDGSERLWTGRFDAPQGEYRYHCTSCEAAGQPAFNMCQRCWDGFQAGTDSHSRDHAFEHIGPRMSRRGGPACRRVRGHGPRQTSRRLHTPRLQAQRLLRPRRHRRGRGSERKQPLGSAAWRRGRVRARAAATERADGSEILERPINIQKYVCVLISKAR